MSIENLSDEALLKLLRKGSKSAFRDIYDKYWYRLYCVAYNNLGSKEDAEELVQELFENIWRKNTEMNIQELGAYLFVAIKHRCNNYIKSQISFRKYQEYLIFQDIFHNQATEELVNFNDLKLVVEKALKNLPEKTSEIFKRSRFEQQSVKNIAEEFELSEKAVEYHITKSIKTLKEELKIYNSEL
jgi:RNA polymerase sigma-70 factor (ECF subfamily)